MKNYLEESMEADDTEAEPYEQSEGISMYASVVMLVPAALILLIFVFRVRGKNIW